LEQKPVRKLCVREKLHKNRVYMFDTRHDGDLSLQVPLAVLLSPEPLLVNDLGSKSCVGLDVLGILDNTKLATRKKRRRRKKIE